MPPQTMRRDTTIKEMEKNKCLKSQYVSAAPAISRDLVR